MPLPAPYRLRIYLAEDMPRLQEITAETFGAVSIDNNMEQKFGGFGEGGWKARKVAAIAEDCRLQPDGVFVALSEEDKVVGYVTTRLSQTSRIGWIPNLAVDPSHQGKGLGRALLEAALDYFRANGMEIAKIETLEQNPIGQALYPQLGFQEVAHQIHYAMRLQTSSSTETETLP